jgi:hypothetical protein
VSGMEPVMVFCPACGGSRARHVPRAAISTRQPETLVTLSQLESCDVCRERGTFPMPGRLIVGSLSGLLDGPAPGLA